MSEFRTPGAGKAKKKFSAGGFKSPASTGNRMKTPMTPNTRARHSIHFPDTFAPKENAILVYEKKEAGTEIKNVPERKQGVWQDGYSAAVSPTELWIFLKDDAPANIEGSKHIHGVWGLDPNSLEPGTPLESLDKITSMNPTDVWVFSPKAKLPKHFIPRGLWTYPIIKRDISQLNPEEAGFLHVGDSVKSHKLDVGGHWRMLYRRDGLPIEEPPLGPGMSPRKASKPKPKPMTVRVRSPDGQIIPIENILPTATLEDLKNRISDEEGTPVEDQRLSLDSKPLTKPEKTLAKHGIQDGDIVDLEGITVYVVPASKKSKTPRMEFANLAPRQTTIADIQRKIQKKGSIPVSQQRLTFNGKPLSKDGKTLKDCGIVHQSTLYLDPMEITVRTPQGQSIPLEVEPTDTLKDIKKQVKSKTGIPIDEQQFLHNGKELEEDPSKDLTDYGIKHGDTLDLDGMQIYVEDPNGKIFELDADPNDTIDQVKDRIQHQLGISKPSQRLTYKTKPLDKDQKTLRDYKIPNKATLKLEPMEIKVKTPKGKIIPLQVNPKDTVHDVKKQVEKVAGIPVDDQRLTHKNKHLGDGTTLEENRVKHGSTLDLEPMEVTVRDPNGRKFVLQDVDPSNAIADIKDRIEDQENIPKDQQRLAFGGKPLSKDNKTLKDYGIKHKSTLNLEPMQVHVQLPDGKKVPLEVDPKDTIADVKKKLNDKEGIPASEQRLEFEDEPLNDKDTVGDAGIKHGDVLRLQPMEILVRDPDGNEFPVQVSPTDTIGDVKDKIEDQEGIPKDEQRLAFKGKPLTKDKKTLRDCGIKHQSVLDLEPMTVNVKTLDGKTIPVHVTPNDTMDDIKQKVKDKDPSVPADDLQVRFNGKELPDQSTVAQNGINHGDTVDLSGMQIIVKDWKNKQFTMDVNPSVTMQEVRERIAKVKEIEPDKQILLYKDKLLDNNDKTLGDCKIPNGATINLDRFKIYVEVENNGKFVMEVDPAWKVKRINQSVEARFNMKLDEQEASFEGEVIEATSTIGSCGIKYKDTVHVSPINVPEYDVKIGAWQDPFAYTPKSPYKKKVGVRKKTLHDLSGDYYAEGQGNTALDVDMWNKEDEQGED